jgi:chemotaxis protein CheD
MTPENNETIVGLGEIAVAQGNGRLTALGLGSCVAVILHDPEGKIGALAHVLLPTQVPAIVQEIKQQGAVLQRTVAKLVGGSTMFGDLLPTGTVHIGERNVLACRYALRQAGIPVVAEAVGGRSGRSVFFDVASGTVTVRQVGRDPQVV